MNAEEYLIILKDQIRDKYAKDYVAKEILWHIEDQADAYQHCGMDREEALAKSVEEMGDPVSVGISLDRIHRPHMEWRFIIYVLFISILSVGLFWIIGRTLFPEDGSWNRLASNHLVWVVIGIIAMFIMYRLDYTFLAGKSRYLAAIYLTLITILPIPFGRSINGASRWIGFGRLSVCIPALLMLYLPIFAGILYDYREKGKSAIIQIILWMIAPIVSRFLYGDSFLSSYNSLILISEIILFILVVRKNWYAVKSRLVLIWSGIIALALIVMGISLLLFNLKSYQVARLEYWLSNLGIMSRPSDTDGMNYINSRLNMILSQSNLLGSSVPALKILNDLPEQTDSLLLGSVSAICGYIGVIGIIVCLFALSIYIFRISCRQKNSLGYVVGCACGTIFAAQSLVNILIVYGLLPMSGSILPFFTTGGSFLIIDYLLLGLILSIYRYKDIRPETKPIKNTLLGA